MLACILVFFISAIRKSGRKEHYLPPSKSDHISVCIVSAVRPSVRSSADRPTERPCCDIDTLFLFHLLRYFLSIFHRFFFVEPDRKRWVDLRRHRLVIALRDQQHSRKVTVLLLHLKLSRIYLNQWYASHSKTKEESQLEKLPSDHTRRTQPFFKVSSTASASIHFFVLFLFLFICQSLDNSDVEQRV